MSKSYPKYTPSNSAAVFAGAPAYPKYVPSHKRTESLEPTSAPTVAPQETSWYKRPWQFAQGTGEGVASLPLQFASSQVRSGTFPGAGIGEYNFTPEEEAAVNLPAKAQQRLASNRPLEGDILGNILYNAGHFGGSLASLPGGAATSILSRLGTGAAIGAASQGLQQAGMNPLAADIASTFVAPNIGNLAKKTAKLPAKASMKLMGLTPKGMNIEAAQAARDLGIDLPAAALTNSKLTALAEQVVGKSPFVGEAIAKKYKTTEGQTKQVIENILDSIGPKRTPEIEQKIFDLYKNRMKSLPKGASVKPTHLEKALSEINIKSLDPTPAEVDVLKSKDKLLKTIQSTIPKGSKYGSKYGDINLYPKGKEIGVDELIGTKQSYNSKLYDQKEKSVKDVLKTANYAITQDIAEYGATNPQWYKKYKEADKLFGDVAKRENIDKILSARGINYATDSIAYNALSKVINTPRAANLLKKEVTPEIFQKIEKLGKVAKTMAAKSKNIPNPSGTASTAAILGFLGGIYAAPVSSLSVAGGTYGLAHLLTDKKFLDSALKYAEKPTTLGAFALNNRIKKVTGHSAVVLNNELARQSTRKKEE